jgi:hypothetical protein
MKPTGPSAFQRGSAKVYGMKERDPEKLKLLYERFRDVCLVEKEVWLELYMPKDIAGDGVRMTNVQDRYEVVIESPEVEAVLEANIPMGAKALAAAIAEYKDAISFIRNG